jgi:hypothetical protein
MPLDKSQIRRGMFLTSDGGPGVFVDATPRYRGRKELGLDTADDKADRLAAIKRHHAVAVAEIAARLAKVKADIDAVQKARKK